MNIYLRKVYVKWVEMTFSLGQIPCRNGEKNGQSSVMQERYKEQVQGLSASLQKRKGQRTMKNPQPNDTTTIPARNIILFQHMTTTHCQSTNC